MIITASELKNRLGRYITGAQREPIEITRSGRKQAVLLSHDEYTELVNNQKTPIDDYNKTKLNQEGES